MRLRHHLAGLSLGRRVALRTLAAFLITFAVLRAITAIIHFNLLPHGPFHYVVTASGLHVHRTPHPVHEERFLKAINSNTDSGIARDGTRFLRIQQVEPERAITHIDGRTTGTGVSRGP
jgi:hypothetical protein